MTTLIIGCGYLGERLAAILRAAGDRVIGTVRSPERADKIAHLGIEPIIADVLDISSLAHLPACDRIFYAVGFDRRAGVSMRSVYEGGLRNVLTQLGASSRRFVYASSTGVYGQTDGSWVDETAVTEPRHESGKICLEAEEIVRAWALAHAPEVTAVVLRYAGLYGPGRVVRKALLERGEPIPGDPDKFLNLIHIEDAARAAAAALGSEQVDPLYVVSDDRPVTRSEYYNLAATLLGTRPPQFVPLSTRGAESDRDATNKRVRSARIKSRLGLQLAFPDITTGLKTCFETAGEA
jgi:nucleoside-diphosphate-sugar epimerase